MNNSLQGGILKGPFSLRVEIDQNDYRFAKYKVINDIVEYEYKCCVFYPLVVFVHLSQCEQKNKQQQAEADQYS